MEWKCFFAIQAYILTACDPVLGANEITNVTLVDGETPNEGRLAYKLPDTTTWESACGEQLSSSVASVVCRQFGYPGVNNFLAQWPLEEDTPTSNAVNKLKCDGDEENIANCSLTHISTTSCTNEGGVICYESGYTGCYTSALGELQTPCENGVQNLTIPKCVSLCHTTDDSHTYAGLYQGNMCFCWRASTTVSTMDKVDDKLCSSPCVGRDIETCGGVTQIALFKIALYLQNTKRTASPPGCAEPTPTQTEGDVTTTVSIQSSSSTTPPATPPATPPPKSSTTPPPKSSTAPPPSSPPSSFPSSPPPTSPPVASTDRTTTEAPTMTEGMPPGGNVQTDLTSPGLYIGVGAGGGILLLVIIIVLVVFIIRRRRSKDKGSSGDHNILELRSMPVGSDLGDFPPLPFSPNNYSLENGHTNMAADDLATGTGVEDSDYAFIVETDMNPVNSARNGSTYEDVPRLESTSGSRRPPQHAPRKSTKDTPFAMHPVHELYTTPDESQLSNGHRDSIPEYAVSQKFRKEPISQAVPQAPPSALGPEDINGLYTMPDKSRNMTKAKKVLDSDMSRPAGIDNALYICRGEDDLQEGETPNEYATDKDGVEAGGEDESDGDTRMVENDLYETSHGHTGGDTGMVENDMYDTSYRPT